jgi:outer membrane protein OmpA-like peptidoglycan-associated protein
MKRKIALSVVFLVASAAVLPVSAFAGRNQLAISVTKDDVDLLNRTLYFKINRPADSAELKVYSIDGKLLAERTEVYKGVKAGQRLSVSWPVLLGDDAENFKLDLKVTDVDEFWIGWEVVKFYMEIPHEEVEFETAKWDIRPSEEYKLEEPLKILLDSIKKHGKTLDCQLYVGGHTDTVGSLADNRELSMKRARAIADYFQSHGVSIPLYVRGFGEENLAVKTEDNVAEQKNRRAVYVLATFPPQMPGPGGWTRIH